MSVIYAERKDFENKVHLITAVVDAPQTEKSREYCADDSRLKDGAFCYRVCGELPKDKRPVAYRYFKRMAYQGEHVDWEECTHDGCEGYDHHFDEDTSTVCCSFKLWEGHGGHCQLMIQVAVI